MGLYSKQLDLRGSRDLKPIFLRTLAMDTQERRQFPNFNAQEEPHDPRPFLHQKQAVQPAVRFNESLDRFDRRVNVKRQTSPPRVLKETHSSRL